MHTPTLILAFAGGLLSFLSPCTLPLLPGYLSYISGLTIDEVEAEGQTGVVVGTAFLFVLGFAIVFVALGATASYLGAALLPYRDTLTRVAGAFIIFMALATIGLFEIPLLYREKRFHLAKSLGTWSALPLGMAFAFGWSPCIGPILASILTVAVADGTAQQGALLLFVYALGLGVPFLLVALFAGRTLHGLTWFKRHYLAINRASGAVLLLMGIFLVLGRWTQLLTPVMQWYANHTLLG